MKALALAAALVASPGWAYTVGTAFTAPCHEELTAAALHLSHESMFRRTQRRQGLGPAKRSELCVPEGRQSRRRPTEVHRGRRALWSRDDLDRRLEERVHDVHQS